jgi:hypothetical protein
MVCGGTVSCPKNNIEKFNVETGDRTRPGGAKIRREMPYNPSFLASAEERVPSLAERKHCLFLARTERLRLDLQKSFHLGNEFTTQDTSVMLQ